MNKYLYSVLGCNIQKSQYKLPLKMPQYLANDYKYQKYLIENQECLFVEPYDFSFVAYKKQYQKIKQITNLHVVLQLKSITQYQRSKLIEERIPFVVEGSQIYLPFLAISLSEKFSEITEIEKFTPITQLVFLYTFYNKTKMSATDMAQKIKCTVMSVSRAYKALIDCGLFRYESDGVKKYICPNYEGGLLLKNAEQYFINPVEKIIYVQDSDILTDCFVSGIYALSKKTMISASENDECYAVYRKKQFEIKNIVPKALYATGNGCKVEKWSYDPGILANNGVVDDISLILSLADRKDERIQMEMDNLRSTYGW